MSSTNKTPNYSLSQFVDDDKPSWRGDMNSDNLKIDTNLHRVDAQTSNNLESITKLQKDVSKAQTDISKAQSDIIDVNNFAENVKNEADNSKNILDSAELKNADDGKAMRNEIRAKANSSDVYSKSSADSKFATIDQVNAKADIGLAYTKAEADKRFEPLKVVEEQTEIVFIGDSYFNGVGVSGGYANGMAKRAADMLGLRDHSYAVNGSGFVTGGDTNTPFLQQVQTAAQDNTYDHKKVKFVVIGGGRNDGGQPYDGWTTTVRTTVQTAANSFPNSKIVVIPGMYDNGTVDKGNSRKFGALHDIANLGPNIAIVDGAYTWGFGEGVGAFSDIHPSNALSQKYGTYIADCCVKMPHDYFITKQWHTEHEGRGDFKNAQLTVSLNHGIIVVEGRGQQNDASDKPGVMINLPNLSNLGIWKDVFGYDDGQSTAPLMHWSGSELACVGNIFGQPYAGRVLNATFTYSILGSV